MRTLNGKLVLVTGAAAGIGRAMALEFARHRANLLLVDVDGMGLAETAIAARALDVKVDVCVADLARSEEVTRLALRVREQFPHLDVLVNNAGVAYYGTTHEMSHEQWRKVLAVNLHAPIQLTRELLHVLFERPEAHILNMCSIAGLVGVARLSAYNASKFALVGFSESLRVEYGPRGLGVTAVCPGLVRTGIFENAMLGGDKAPRRFPAWLTASPERGCSIGFNSSAGCAAARRSTRASSGSPSPTTNRAAAPRRSGTPCLTTARRAFWVSWVPCSRWREHVDRSSLTLHAHTSVSMAPLSPVIPSDRLTAHATKD
jgi:NAD(P)-dependent dehydrogenase (short-subunit alcohol dehydrogenase family)